MSEYTSGLEEMPEVGVVNSGEENVANFETKDPFGEDQWANGQYNPDQMQTLLDDVVDWRKMGADGLIDLPEFDDTEETLVDADTSEEGAPVDAPIKSLESLGDMVGTDGIQFSTNPLPPANISPDLDFSNFFNVDGTIEPTPPGVASSGGVPADWNEGSVHELPRWDDFGLADDTASSNQIPRSGSCDDTPPAQFGRHEGFNWAQSYRKNEASDSADSDNSHSVRSRSTTVQLKKKKQASGKKQMRPTANSKFKPKKEYATLPQKPASWGSGKCFKYNKYGELHQDLMFSAEQMKEYIWEHPLHDLVDDTRHSKLIIRIQRNAPLSASRYPYKHGSHRCRLEDCVADYNTINQGVMVVAFDELSSNHPNLDPFLTAGYVHLYCLERAVDFPKICEIFNVQAEDRKFRFEPKKKNLKHGNLLRLDPPEVERAAKTFLKACQTHEIPQDYPRFDFRDEVGQPYKNTLCHILNSEKLKFQPKAVIRQEIGREIDARRRKEGGATLSRHVGDLVLESQARERTRCHENQNRLLANPKQKRVYKDDATKDESDTDDEQEGSSLEDPDEEVEHIRRPRPRYVVSTAKMLPSPQLQTQFLEHELQDLKFAMPSSYPPAMPMAPASVPHGLPLSPKYPTQVEAMPPLVFQPPQQFHISSEQPMQDRKRKYANDDEDYTDERSDNFSAMPTREKINNKGDVRPVKKLRNSFGLGGSGDTQHFQPPPQTLQTPIPQSARRPAQIPRKQVWKRLPPTAFVAQTPPYLQQRNHDMISLPVARPVPVPMQRMAGAQMQPPWNTGWQTHQPSNVSYGSQAISGIKRKANEVEQSFSNLPAGHLLLGDNSMAGLERPTKKPRAAQVNQLPWPATDIHIAPPAQCQEPQPRQTSLDVRTIEEKLTRAMHAVSEQAPAFISPQAYSPAEQTVAPQDLEIHHQDYIIPQPSFIPPPPPPDPRFANIKPRYKPGQEPNMEFDEFGESTL